MSLWNGLKRGTKALLQGEEPVSYVAGGRKIQCPHCDSDRFVASRVLLNTYGCGIAFGNLNWANKEATTLTCDHCKLIQWFRVAPEQAATNSEKMIREF